MRFANALIAAGLLLLAGGGAWQLGWIPGSRVTLPEPVVLQRRAGTIELTPIGLGVPPVPTGSNPLAARPPTVAPPTPFPPAALAQPTPLPPAALAPPTPFPPAALAQPTPLPSAALARPTPFPTAALARPTPFPTAVVAQPTPDLRGLLAVADANDRSEAALLPAPGYAVRLSIPAINLDTPVKQGGVVLDKAGNPQWETLPFVAVHYGDLTALVGAHGNAVIAGHVVTLYEGNVFRNLYRVDLSDTIRVWDDQAREHDFVVVDVKLVPPTDLSPMSPTVDRTLTLITCGGTFDPVKREFSDRLIVTAKAS